MRSVDDMVWPISSCALRSMIHDIPHLKYRVLSRQTSGQYKTVFAIL